MKKFCLGIGVFMIASVICPVQGSAQSPVRVVVSAPAAPLFVKPDTTMTPLRLAKDGSILNVVAGEGEWFRVEFNDPQWGRQVGYIEKRHVSVIATTARLDTSSHHPLVSTSSTARVPSALPQSEPVADHVRKPTEQPKSAGTKVPKKIKSETIAGYVEWMHGDHLIADGQRVRWDARTRTRIGRVRSVNAIPLGYEVKVKGFRNTEGAIVAGEIEAKRNGAALFEADVIAGFNTIENQWLREGQMFEPQPDGGRSGDGSGCGFRREGPTRPTDHATSCPLLCRPECPPSPCRRNMATGTLLRWKTGQSGCSAG